MVLHATPPLEPLLGWKPVDIVGLPLVTLIPERLRDKHRDAFGRFFKTGEGNLFGTPVVLPALHSNGREVTIELTLSRVERDGRTLVLGALRDPSTRIELERHRDIADRLLTAMAEAGSSADAGAKILASICEALGWQTGTLWAMDPVLKRVRCETIWQESPFPAFLEATQELTFALGEGLPGRVWKSGEPVWIEDAQHAGDFPRVPAARADGIHAGFGFPIRAEGEIVGVIEFFSTEVREPDEELLATMTEISDGIGRFIIQKRRDDETRFQNTLLSTLSENTLEAILIIGVDGQVLSYNSRYLEIWEIGPEVMIHASETLLPVLLDKVEDPEYFETSARSLLADPEQALRDEIRLKNGRILDRYTVPLRGEDGRLYGRASYSRDISREREAEEQLELSYQRYRQLAKTLQRSLLPPALPVIPGLEVAARYDPVASGLVVGGDFYDLFQPNDDEWALVIGDAAGKGVEAAALTAQVRHTIRAVSAKDTDPARVLAETNDILRPQTDEGYSTVIYGRISAPGDVCTFSFASAGHPLPVIVRRDGSIERKGETGLPVALFPGETYRTIDIDLEPGDAVVLFTDGVPDAGAPRNALGDKGITEALRGAADGSAEGLASALDSAAGGAADPKGARDDRAILVVKRPSA